MEPGATMRGSFPQKERILIFEVNWLGDVLLSTPAIRAVRQKFPGAYVAALVVPRGKAVLAGNNYLDEILVFDEEGRHQGFRGKLRLIRDLRVRRFSVAYLLKSSRTRSWWVWLAGIGRRIGYRGQKGEFFLTDRVALPKEKLHRADIYHYLVAHAKIPDGERTTDFLVTFDDKQRVEDFLKRRGLGEGRKIIVLHAGGNWELKLWPRENFVRLIDALTDVYAADVILTGTFKERPFAEEIVRQTRGKPVVACGLLSLKQLGALFQKSDLVISADSAPLHIAAAMEARTIALFGPTSAEITGPMGRGDFSVLRDPNNTCAIPCYNLECRDNVCMRSISVEKVLEEAEKRGWLTRRP